MTTQGRVANMIHFKRSIQSQSSAGYNRYLDLGFKMSA
jgi:hypothetical protein